MTVELVRKELLSGPARISYLEGPPSGPPMVWVHGVSRRAESCRPQLEAFGGAWQVFALDARGHGQSERVPGKYTWLDHAGDLVAFLRERVHEPAVLVGHSLGALEVVKAAADLPDFVAAGVLEDPPLYSGERTDYDFSQFKVMELAASSGMTVDQILAAWPAEPWMTGAFRSDQAESLTELDPENLRVTTDLSATLGFDVDGHLSRIRCPMLVMRAGGAGGALPVEDEERALRQLVRGQAIVFEDSGHLIHAQHPEDYRHAIEDYLVSLRQD